VSKTNIPGARCYYQCSFCPRKTISQPVPEPPALPVFGLPAGWEIVPTPLDRGQLACWQCAAKECAAKEKPTDTSERRTK
jgi:hypothetical protein